MTFSEEKIVDHLEEAKPLLLKHWQELESDQFPLDPDYDLYIQLEKEGKIKTYAAKDDQGKLIGYSVYVLRYHPHYKTILVAGCDLVFIDPASRGQGLKFIQWCDEQLQAAGIKVIVHHVKVDHDFSPALIRMGYKADEIQLIKRF